MQWAARCSTSTFWALAMLHTRHTMLQRRCTLLSTSTYLQAGAAGAAASRSCSLATCTTGSGAGRTAALPDAGSTAKRAAAATSTACTAAATASQQRCRKSALHGAPARPSASSKLWQQQQQHHAQQCGQAQGGGTGSRSRQPGGREAACTHVRAVAAAVQLKICTLATAALTNNAVLTCHTLPSNMLYSVSFYCFCSLNRRHTRLVLHQNCHAVSMRSLSLAALT